ncbi:MAG: stalk domain-containing protein [Bacillota bacterium]|nr:stalk domain-containing protein [Bacillota bacterium]
MRYKIKLFSILMLLFVVFSSYAFAHSGRTDSSGGHYDRKTGTYHYHNSGSSSNSSSSPSTVNDVDKIILENREFNLIQDQENLILLLQDLSSQIEELKKELDEINKLLVELTSLGVAFVPSDLSNINLNYDTSRIQDDYFMSRSIYRDSTLIWEINLDTWESDLSRARVKIDDYSRKISSDKNLLSQTKIKYTTLKNEANAKQALSMDETPKTLNSPNIDLTNGIPVYINSTKLDFGDVNPQNIEGRLLVPLRVIFEALGADIEWFGAEHKVIAERGSTQIELTVGSKIAYRNGQPITLEVEAMNIDGRVLVPLRFVGEALGNEVIWEVETNTVRIISIDSGEEKAKKELTVHFIDVGQGDSILIQSPSGKTMLIDAGERTAGQKVVSYLKAAGISSIDWVVSTHPHADHIGGLITVLETFPVANVLDPAVVHTSKTFEDYLTLIDKKEINFVEARSGMTVNFDSLVKVEVLAPGSEASKASLNNTSVVLKLSFGEVSFLLAGDAETDSENIMLRAHSNKLKSTILKVGHHGSKSSTTANFLKAVSPEAAIIQVGKNSYGHPTEEALNRLDAASVKIYRNDLHGDIIISTDGKNYQINIKEPFKPEAKTAVSPAPVPVPTPSPTPEMSTGEININNASFEELQEIIHIGPARAQSIIDGRPWKSLDQLTSISGISVNRLYDIKNEGKAYVK